MGEQRVDDAMELGQVAGLVEIGEPVEGGEGAGLVVGEVQAVQLAERVPGVAQPRVRLEDGFELGALGVVEAVGAAQQQEPGPEHVGVERRREPFGLAALHVAAHRGEPGGEPADDVETVQHVRGVTQVAVDGRPVWLRAVGNDDPHALATCRGPVRPRR